MKKIIFFLTLLTTLGFADTSSATTKHIKAVHRVVHHTKSVHKNTPYAAPSCSSGTVSSNLLSTPTTSGMMTAPAMSARSLDLSTPMIMDNGVNIGIVPDGTRTSSLIGHDYSTEQSANNYYHGFRSRTTTINGYSVVESNDHHSTGNSKGVDETAGFGVSPRAASLPTSFGSSDYGSMNESR